MFHDAGDVYMNDEVQEVPKELMMVDNDNDYLDDKKDVAWQCLDMDDVVLEVVDKDDDWLEEQEDMNIDEMDDYKMVVGMIHTHNDDDDVEGMNGAGDLCNANKTPTLCMHLRDKPLILTYLNDPLTMQKKLLLILVSFLLDSVNK